MNLYVIAYALNDKHKRLFWWLHFKYTWYSSPWKVAMLADPETEKKLFQNIQDIRNKLSSVTHCNCATGEDKVSKATEGCLLENAGKGSK